MATKGATKDYSFGTKNHWRRTIWNEIVRRAGNKTSHETVLYLAGSEDKDRKIAVGKGIPNDSLVAIDRDRVNVAAVRAEHNKAIDADALDLLWSWPEKRPVCAAVLDFCGGISNATMGLYDAFQREPLRKAVIVLNLQRGRDAAAVKISDALEQCGLLQPLWRGRVGSSDDEDLECLVSDVKHRGYLYLMHHALDVCSIAVGMAIGQDYGSANTDPNPDMQSQVRIPIFPVGSEQRMVFAHMMGSHILSCNPKFYSYRSGNLVFDSVIFEHPLRGLGDASFKAFAGEEHDSLIKEHLKRISDLESSYASRKLQNKVRATFAVATQKLKRWL